MNKTIQSKMIIVQGWILMFILSVVHLTVWNQQLGARAVQIILPTMVIYALLPMLIQTLSQRWFKYLVLILSVAITLIYMAVHHLAHEAGGPGMQHSIAHLLSLTPDRFPHLIHASHHIVGIWTVFACVKWIRHTDN